MLLCCFRHALLGAALMERLATAGIGPDGGPHQLGRAAQVAATLEEDFLSPWPFEGDPFAGEREEP